jgi:hypothetical protein
MGLSAQFYAATCTVKLLRIHPRNRLYGVRYTLLPPLSPHIGASKVLSSRFIQASRRLNIDLRRSKARRICSKPCLRLGTCRRFVETEVGAANAEHEKSTPKKARTLCNSMGEKHCPTQGPGPGGSGRAIKPARAANPRQRLLLGYKQSTPPQLEQ